MANVNSYYTIVIISIITKPDIMFEHKKQRQFLLINVAIPSDYNNQKEAKKQLKYKDLQIESHMMWNKKTSIIPVVIEATGLVSKRTQETIKLIADNHNHGTHYTQSTVAVY